MRDDTTDAVTWTLDYLVRLLCCLTGRLGGAIYVERGAYRAVAREVSELEACARRTLIVLAVWMVEAGRVSWTRARLAPPPTMPGMSLTSQATSPASAAGGPPEGSSRAKSRTGTAPARIPLLEPLPRYSFSETPWWQGLAPSDRPKDARPLARRLAALGVLLSDPEAAARRMARQLARIRSRALARTIPLNLARQVWRGDPSRDVFSSIAADMHTRAIGAVNALGP